MLKMTELPAHDAALSDGRTQVRETVRRHSGLMLLQAALMIVAGVLAFVYPLLSALAVTLFLGWMLIFSGVVQALTLVVTSRVPHFWLQLVSAVLSVITGILFVRNPGVAVTTLALLLVIFFMVEGFAKIVFAFTVRPLPNWGWVLVSGLIGVAIAVYLLSNPALSLLALGLFIGLQLIGEGIAIGMLAWDARKRATKP
jgi:uncharacterized membrane protein HdeD (DUF308 family)